MGELGVRALIHFAVGGPAWHLMAFLYFATHHVNLGSINDHPFKSLRLEKGLPHLCYHIEFEAHFRHLYPFRSINVVSTSHNALLSVLVGGREASACPSLGEQSLVLHVSSASLRPCSNALMDADPADGSSDSVVVLPYMLSSQSSILDSIVILGRRANSRMLYLFSRAGSVHGEVLPAFVSSRPRVWISIPYVFDWLPYDYQVAWCTGHSAYTL